MKARLLCALGAALALTMGPLGTAPAHADEIVSIPDAALRGCVTAALSEAKLPTVLVDANIARLTWLSCGAAGFRGIRDLGGLDHLTGLATFALYDSTVTDLAPLAAITGLRSLYLQSSALTDGSPLASLPDLHVLQLTAGRITDVRFVKQMTSLGRVSLLVSPKSDFGPLGALTDLTWLEVAVDRASDLAVITTLDRLMYLTLATEATRLPTLILPPTAVALMLNGTNLSSLEDLPDAPQLKYLEVMGAPSIHSLHGVERLTGLGSAVIRNNGYADLSPLSGLTGLRSLDISGNAISDLTPISGLTGLTELRFNANQITDLSPLGRLTALTTLDTSSNPATDLSALSQLTSLEWLSISAPKDIVPLTSLSALSTLLGSNIGSIDLSPLAGLPHLTSLHLPYGSFTTLGARGGFTHLTQADFSFGRLTSVEGLRDAHKLTRLDLSENRELSDISPLSGIGVTAKLNLHGAAVKDLSPLPDALDLDAGSQVLGYPALIDAGQPIDLGIRSLTGVPICPTFSPAARCAGGVVTYPARGTFTGSTRASDSTGFSVSFTVYVGPDRPFMKTHAPTLSGHPAVGPPVTAYTKSWAPEPASYSYQWYRDGAPITGSHDGDLYWPVAADRGHRLTVCVTGHLANYVTKKRCSAASSRVVRGTLRAPRPNLTGAPVTDATLTAAPGSWTEGTTLRYQWQKNHKNIRGATSATLRLRASDVGDHIRVRITGSKPAYHSRTRDSASVTPRKAAFSAGNPEVTGTPTVGQTLTVQPSAWTPQPTHLSYQWYRDGASIKGATKTTYLLTAKDAGAQIKVRVTGTRAGYGTRSVHSEPTALIVA